MVKTGSWDRFLYQVTAVQWHPLEVFAVTDIKSRGQGGGQGPGRMHSLPPPSSAVLTLIT